MSIAEEFEHNGKTVRLHYEEDTEFANPRDADNLGIMLASGHRQYTLGDEDYSRHLHGEYDDAKAALEELADRRKIRLFPRWCQIYLGATVVLPLGLIDHSGLSMYVGAGAHWADPGGWDSGLVGFIFDTAKRREVCGTPLDRIEEGLRTEVEEYDKWLTGDVYWYEVEGEDGDAEDSCGGLLGYDYAMQSARDAAGYTCKHCGMEIKRWVGPVMDEGDGDFVHSCCVTCGRDVEWGGDGWFHNTMKPWDWPDGKPDHVAQISHRHACADGRHQAETDQKVGKYT